MAGNTIENIGYEFIKALFGMLEFDITEYCNAGIDDAYLYCIQEFKKACDDVGLEWDPEWEGKLNA